MKVRADHPIYSILEQARAKILSVYRNTAESVESDYIMMTEQRYKDTHNGRKPEEDGHVMFDKQVDGEMKRVCVVRVQAEGEWRMVSKDETGQKLEEIVDDGKGAISKDQHDRKFKKLQDTMLTTRNVAIKTDAQDDTHIMEAFCYIPAIL